MGGGGGRRVRMRSGTNELAAPIEQNIPRLTEPSDLFVPCPCNA